MKRLFEYAEENQVCVLLHITFFDEDASKEKAEKFVQEILIPNPKQTLIIAHMGGAASYRQQNRDVINVFNSYLKTDERLKQTKLYFELSAVLLPRASQGIEPPDETMVKALVADIKTIGLDRILFGSDYPGFGPNEYANHLREALPLEESEIEQIFSNRIGGLDFGKAEDD